jgi:two-component system cell cycle sensor histidine kinase/response regulator CckA
VPRVTKDIPDFAAARKPAADLQVRAAVHDANQLLWVIQGQASRLLQEPGDETVAAVAGRIAAAARDAAAVLRPLLGLAETADEPRDLDCDVTETLWSVWRRCVEGATARGLATGSLQLDAPLPPGPRAAVPELPVSRILANLLANAIEAMTAGGQVTCRIEMTGDDIEIELRDHGPGLPAAVAAAPFTGEHRSRKPHGHGIGLAGCWQLARDHGGDLELVAAAGLGAVFRLRLPAAPKRLRVLAVDDEATVREMLADVLGAEGHEVRLAAGDEDVRRSFAAGGFDVVLLDYRLPGRSGLDLADDLRREDRAVAIVLMTGWGPAGERPTTSSATVDFVAMKPLDMPALQSLLRGAGALTVQRRRISR